MQEAGTKASGNDNANATPEVLVAIGNLATALGQATIDGVNFATGQTISGAGGSSISRRFTLTNRLQLQVVPSNVCF